MRQWVNDWIEDISKVDESIGMPLCPFAQKAWQQGAVDVVHTDNLWESVHKAVDTFGKHKVVICIQDDLDQSYEDLELECAALNRWFAFKKIDIWLLSSHRDYFAVLVQRLSELDAAAVALEKMGYYKQYQKADYDRLILQRRTLRHNPRKELIK